MFELIALLLPPAIVPLVRRYKGGQRGDDLLFEFILSVLVVDVMSVLVAHFAFKGENNLSELLRTNSMVWAKFTLTSCALSLGMALTSVWAQEHIKIEFERPLFFSRLPLRPLVVIVALVFLMLHLSRIFNFDFWGDEAFSIRLARDSIEGAIQQTASDVHPPLYYLILMLFYRAFGDVGWAYNIVSVIPYFLTLLVALTLVWRRFGGSATLVFIALTTFSTAAIRYNVEVRMYSWAALFSLLSFLWLLRILEKKARGDWILFCVFSLAASYTHYYALLFVAFLYLSLIVLSLAKFAKLRNTLILCAMTLIGYAPWLSVLLQALNRTSSNFWMTETPGLWESIRWMLEVGNGAGGTTLLLLVVFVLLFLSALLRGLGLAGIIQSRRDWKIILRSEPSRLDALTAWVVAGIASALACAFFGVAVSAIIRPMFSVRYLYPAASVTWLLLGVLISCCDARKLLSIILTLLVLRAGIPVYNEVRSEELAVQSVQSSTLNSVADISQGDVLLTDGTMLGWTVLEAYFPDATVVKLDGESLPSLDSDTNYWLVHDESVDSEYLNELLGGGITLEEKVHDGNLGRRTVDIYKVEVSEDAS